MAYQPVAATALIEIVYLANGQTCENTLYFRHATTGWSPAELTALAQAIQNWWVGEMAGITSNEIGIVRIDATDLSDQFGPKVIFPVTPTQLGTNPSPPLPNNATFCTTFTTGLRGRAFRGRNFFVGLAENFATGNQVSVPFATSLVNAYSELLGATYLPVGVDWMVVTRVVNGVVQMPTALTNAVLSAVHADLNVDSQRRRLTGRGQ